MIHSETTSGLINPIEDIGPAIKEINPKVIFFQF
jgi:aspartate aminotransferase-like enzyme